jgi:uncharacterized membrane protein
MVPWLPCLNPSVTDREGDNRMVFFKQLLVQRALAESIIQVHVKTPILFLLSLTFLFVACTSMEYPKRHIPVRLGAVGLIDTNNKEISLVNGLTESKLIRLEHGFSVADLKRWTDLIINQLEAELKKRGVQVKPNSDCVFKVSAENVMLIPNPWWGTRCIVEVRVEKSGGKWSRIYEGNNYGRNVQPAIDGAVYRLLVAIIEDQDFRKAISKEAVGEEEKIAKRLEKLKELRAKGLITEEEYQNKKREILRSF